MKYTFSFPHLLTSHNNTTFSKIEVIKALRQLCPGLGLKEAKEMTEQSGDQELFVSPSIDPTDLLQTLHSYGVKIVEQDPPEGEHGYPLPTWRPVETDTLGDIRTVAIAALDRGEYDIAIALIELIKRNS